MSASVICGDARNETAKAVERMRADGFDPVIVTDPPFNIGYKYISYNDRMKDTSYWQMLCEIRHLCEGAVFINYPESLHRMSIELGEEPERVISWVYASNTGRQHRDVAYYGVKPDLKRVKQPYKNMDDKRIKELYKRTGGGRSYDWINENQVKNVSKEKTAHPCQMPLKVMELVVGILPDGVGVIDPFCGSGTTLLACRKRGIPAIGIDMDQSYCEITEGRLERGF